MGGAVCEGSAQLGENCHAALNGGSASYALKPVLQLGVVWQVNALVFPGIYPRVDGDVGDGVLMTSHISITAELLLKNTIESVGLFGVSIDRILDFLGSVDSEVMGLAQHGT